MGNPFVSVVILSLDPPYSLIAQLHSQTYKDFEIIIAQEKGIVNAMNKALERAKGEIFVRIDDDVELPPNWLEYLVNGFKAEELGGCTGPTFIPKERRMNRDSIRWAENPNWFLKWLYDNGEFNPGGIRKCGVVSYDSNFDERFTNKKYWDKSDHLEGTNWAMRTDLIRRVGGFDPKFDGVAEWFDDDVVFKAKKLGYEFYFNPKAYLYHMIEPSNPTFHERFDGFGRIKNFLRFHWRHARWRFLYYKFYIYLIIWGGYFLCQPFRSLFRRFRVGKNY